MVCAMTYQAQVQACLCAAQSAGSGGAVEAYVCNPLRAVHIVLSRGGGALRTASAGLENNFLIDR